MTLEEKKVMSQLRINAFKESFLKEFGVGLIITVKAPLTNKPELTLNTLGIVIDDIVTANYPGLFPEGIKQKTRKIELLNYRQCFCKIGMDCGHTSVAVANAIGFDHATVLHANKHINLMVETKNDRTIFNLNIIYRELQERFGVNADIQSDQPTRHNS